jgi:hypothetical protein
MRCTAVLLALKRDVSVKNRNRRSELPQRTHSAPQVEAEPSKFAVHQ